MGEQMDGPLGKDLVEARDAVLKGAVDELSDYISIGPGAFAIQDLSVISYRGENYYKACGEKVKDIVSGGTSTCVFPARFPHETHIDSSCLTEGGDLDGGGP